MCVFGQEEIRGGGGCRMEIDWIIARAVYGRKVGRNQSSITIRVSLWFDNPSWHFTLQYHNQAHFCRCREKDEIPEQQKPISNCGWFITIYVPIYTHHGVGRKEPADSVKAPRKQVDATLQKSLSYVCIKCIEWEVCGLDFGGFFGVQNYWVNIHIGRRHPHKTLLKIRHIQ